MRALPPSRRGRQGAAHASLRPERLVEVRWSAKFARHRFAASDIQRYVERMPAPIPADAGATWLGTWSRPADRPGQIALALACLLLVTALVPGGPRRLIAALDFSGTG